MLKNKLGFVLYLAGYFYALILLFRIGFLGVNFSKTLEIGLSTSLQTFLYGLRMDMAVLAYLLVLPLLCIGLGIWINKKFIINGLNIYIILILAALIAIGILDMGMYPHWGYRLDAGVWFYLKSPKSALASVGMIELGLALVGFIGALWAGFRFYQRKVGDWLVLSEPTAAKPLQKAAQTGLFVLSTAALIIPIRGGVQQIPMGLSHAYFSPLPFANHAALNVFWGFVHSLTQAERASNNYAQMSSEVAQKTFGSLYPSAASASTHKLLKNPRPNLVIIILEGFTSNLIGCVGGEKGICKNLDAFSKKGVLFTNMYASGDRTEKGLLAVLGGYPALPLGSMAAYPQKNQQLPSLLRDFGKQGYKTAFYYGGELEFAGMKAYLLGQGTQKMTEKSDFPKTAHDTKWGAFDHVVLEKALAEQNQSYQPNQPFFTTILTLSSHEPFHVPMKTVIEGTDEPSMFKNSVVYADSALGAFLRAAEQSEWWANTLVVLVADHGHRLPAYLPLHSLGKYKIPMLWLGGALAVQDTQIHTYAQQTDIAATINAQYGWDYSQYKFSKDILNPTTKGFGFYTFNDGWGFVENDSNYAVVDNISQQFLEAKGDTARLKNLGRAYLQVLSQDFLDK